MKTNRLRKILYITLRNNENRQIFLKEMLKKFALLYNIKQKIKTGF